MGMWVHGIRHATILQSRRSRNYWDKKREVEPTLSRRYSVHFLIQEEADDMDKREVFKAVPSLAHIDFFSDGDTPKEVQTTLREIFEKYPDRITWYNTEKSSS